MLLPTATTGGEWRTWKDWELFILRRTLVVSLFPLTRQTLPSCQHCVHSDSESQLYYVRDVADANGQPEIFDNNLGNFMKNTFILELEYMFVQVGRLFSCYVHMY